MVGLLSLNSANSGMKNIFLSVLLAQNLQGIIVGWQSKNMRHKYEVLLPINKNKMLSLADKYEVLFPLNKDKMSLPINSEVCVNCRSAITQSSLDDCSTEKNMTKPSSIWCGRRKETKTIKEEARSNRHISTWQKRRSIQKITHLFMLRTNSLKHPNKIALLRL